MRLSDFAIDNPVKVVVGVVLLAMFGLLSLYSIPVQLTPEVSTPLIMVITRWPGASPQEMEKEIISKQEEQLQGIEGLVDFRSRSSDGRGEIEMEFRVGTDLRSTLLKVGNKLDQVREYPEDADRPVLLTASADSSAIAYLNLIPAAPSRAQLQAVAAAHPELRSELEPLWQASEVDVTRVYRLASRHPAIGELIQNDLNPWTLRTFVEDKLVVPIENVKGVGDTEVYGGAQDEVRVVVDPAQLAARHITIPDLRRALAGENKDISAGDIWEGKRRYVVRTLGQFHDLDQVAEVIVAYRDGTPVRVRDVATVELTTAKLEGMSHQRGVNMLTIAVQREQGANVLEVMAGVREVVLELNEGLLKSRGLYLLQSYDETVYIDSAIGLVRDNVYVGGLLAIGVLFLFLRDIRSTLVIAVSIAISCIGTLLAMRLTGRTLNVISLAGMSFAVGMLVDNVIVVLENIYTYYQQGQSPRAAACQGTADVWGAILASSATNLAVFLPVIFIQEEAGQLFRDIAIVICAGVAISMVVGMTVVPCAAARLLRSQDSAPDWVLGKRQDRLTRLGTGFYRLVERTNERLLSGQLGPLARLGAAVGMGVGAVCLVRYAWATEERAWWGAPGALTTLALALVLAAVLAWRLPRLAVVAMTFLLSMGISVALVPPVEYLPEGNENLVFAMLQPPAGYNVERLMELGGQVEDRLRPYWEARLGTPEAKKLDGPAMENFFLVARRGGMFMGARAAEPERASDLVPVLQRATEGLAGVTAFVNQSSLFDSPTMSGGRSIEIEITGPDQAELASLGQRVMQRVQAIYPTESTKTSARAIPSLDQSSPEMHVRRNPEKAAERGITNVDLGYTVNALVDGAYAGTFWHQGKELDLKIYGADEFARRTQDIGQLPLVTPGGEIVQLADVADVVLTTGAETVMRIDRERALTIMVNLGQAIALEEAMRRIDREVLAPLREEAGPLGLYRLRLAGTADKLRQMRTAMAGSMLLALVITYLLIAGLYESFIYPIVIMISVPLGAVGGIAGLALLNVAVVQRLDSLTMLGFVMLIGTVVNNAILIVDQALFLIRTQGRPPRQAVVEGVLGRLRPIFMTTFTAVLGLLPLVVMPGAGSELYRGLGAVMLGGLLISTVFMLFVVPLLFTLFHEAEMWLRGRWGRPVPSNVATESLAGAA